MDNRDSAFGVLDFLHWDHVWNNHQYPDDASLKKSLSLMRKVGAGWVRTDFLWQDIEPKKGEFNFDKYDRIVRLVKETGINILGILHYSVDWDSPTKTWNDPSSATDAFVNYARTVIDRYKDTISYWEVWNEPDSSIYWKNQDGLKSYCILLRDVYYAAKEIDPECKILNGGLITGMLGVSRLYEHGAKDFFDILNIHIFVSPLIQGATSSVSAYASSAFKIMQRYNDEEKKIWVTEIGCPGVKKGIKTKNWWLGENPDEEEQAAWVKDVYTLLLENPSVEKVFWAFFRDTDKHWRNGIDYFGLIRNDFSIKPSFKAYQDSVKGKK